MKNQPKLYFITGNRHKFAEVSELFAQEDLNYELRQKDLNPTEIQADTLEEVARFKLSSVKSKLDVSYFIEDAGFFVDIPLKGFPGVYSSYVFKTLGNEGILSLIKNFDDTKAHFSSVIALYYKPSEQIYLFKGRVDGKVSSKIKGNRGFGYDPIFISDIQPDKTFAELSKLEKNHISHRGIALRKLIEFLKKLN
ncbi:MAG: XTP/dITP diphosphatase [Promethearchaeota archaeon]|nr:MAG: XTP/dITP diphosphatase [Candidatus Lokiarchaeota archaeon]